jgi:hypothetical protein
MVETAFDKEFQFKKFFFYLAISVKVSDIRKSFKNLLESGR